MVHVYRVSLPVIKEQRSRCIVPATSRNKYAASPHPATNVEICLHSVVGNLYSYKGYFDTYNITCKIYKIILKLFFLAR